jgi:hypothetical protein
VDVDGHVAVGDLHAPGTPDEDVAEKVVTLAEGKEMHEIVTVTFK